MARKASKSSLAGTPTSPSVPQTISDPALPLPRLIVFDLDYTLWPFWVDTHVTPPLKPNASHTLATDKLGEEYAFYTDVPAILISLAKLGVKLAVASRTHAPGLAKELLKMLSVDSGGDSGSTRSIDMFEGGMEIYPSSKIKHFEALQKRSGVAYGDMLFFDDESRNRETESLGVTMWLVEDGVSWGAIEKGVGEWRKRREYAMS